MSTNNTIPPEFDPQTSLYGPGALSCWYHTLLCVLITWTTHPTHSFNHLGITPDLVVFALYPCIAAGHLALQTSRFHRDHLPPLLPMLDAQGPENTLDPNDEALKAAAASFCGSFHVTALFATFAMCTLSKITRMDDRIQDFKLHQLSGLLTSRGRSRSKWKAPLPWLLLLSGVWVSGCLGFVALSYSVLEMAVGLVMVVGQFGLFVLGLISIPFAAVALTALLMSPIGVLTVLGLGDSPRYSSVWTRAAVVVVPLVSVAIGGLLLYCIPSRDWSYALATILPNVGVRISALDQLLALGTGVVALLFTVWGARSRMPWKLR